MIRVAGVSLVLVACASPVVGRWDSDGFHRATYEYSIAGDGAELVEGWRLDNWVYSNDGPSEPFSDDANWVSYRYDTTGDGVVDFEQRLPIADVLLQHGETGATLWIQLVPVEPRRDARRMRVLLREWVRNAAGAKYRFHRAGTGTTTVSESRWTTLVTQANDARVAGLTSAAASFVVTDVDRLQMAPDHRDRMGRAVLVATPFVREPNRYSREVPLRFALLVVLLADPADYEERLSDLDALVRALGLPGDGGPTEGVLPPVAAREQPEATATEQLEPLQPPEQEIDAPDLATE